MIDKMIDIEELKACIKHFGLENLEVRGKELVALGYDDAIELGECENPNSIKQYIENLVSRNNAELYWICQED